MRENRRPDIGSVQSAPSVPAALEKIASATQRVISKRIDLVMLENHEFVSTLIARAALISFGVVVALSAWFAGIAAVVFYLMPNSGVVLHLAVSRRSMQPSGRSSWHSVCESNCLRSRQK